MKVKLQVTPTHIANGVTTSYSCPIALAIQDALPNYDEVEVDAGIVVHLMEPMDGYLYRHEYKLYKEEQINEVCSFILNFDAGREVDPFELDLDFEEVVREPPDPEY